MRWLLFLVVASGCAESVPVDVKKQNDYIREVNVGRILDERIAEFETQFRTTHGDDDPDAKLKQLSSKLAMERLHKTRDAQRLRIQTAEQALYSGD